MARLTIGLPVYNGAKTLARSLDNLIAQTHTDFVAIISDNASTDETADICRDYMRRDARLTYFRHPENIVWNENFRSVLARAETPYFMWMTHDDIWDRRFAEENIRLLDADPEAVCSTSRTIYFDADGNEHLSSDTQPLTGPPGQRMRDYFLRMDACARFYGVYRTKVLQESFPPNLQIFGTDWLVVALTLLHGTHLEVEEVLLRREGQTSNHYIRKFGVVDRFEKRRFEILWPLQRLEQELRARLPREVWRETRWALRYLDLRMLMQVVETYIPQVRHLTNPLRQAIRSVGHERWRRNGIAGRPQSQ